MRRITLWLVGTVAVVVLLFSYRTSTSGPDRGNAVSGEGAGIVSSPAASGAPAGNAPVTVRGSVADTRWGPVQVQVTIAAGKITEITVLKQPSGNREDRQINGYALPLLHDQVLAAQSANIDGVSGATVTSDGYRRSLQAALDAAHFPG